jgi:ribosome-binding protein aMBF1 (putative translation factor)
MRRTIASETLKLGGTTYVVVEKQQFDALETLAAMPEFPPLPADSPRELLQVETARRIIRERIRLGLSQAELARRSGIADAMLNRIEAGTQSPGPQSAAKIDAALKAADSGTKRRKRTQRG